MMVDAHYGHFTAMGGLARELLLRGHFVSFATPDETFARRISACDYDILTLPWLSSSLRPNSTRQAAHDHIRERMVEAERGARALFNNHSWDLALVDPFLLWAYPWIARHVRAVALSTKPLLTPDPLVPPWTSAVVPAHGLSARIKVAGTWWRTRLDYERYRLRCALLEIRTGQSHRSLARGSIRSARHDPADWACRPVSIDMRYRSAGELVLHAAEFDLPRARALDEGVAYLGPCIDVPRVPDRCRHERLVFCSFGTEMSAEDALPKYRAVMAAVSDMPDVNLAISTGKKDLSAALRNEVACRNSNVEIHDWVDAKSMFVKAATTVIHCGANSTKEAIAARCPIVAMPTRADQPGMAARVVYHGLGTAPKHVRPPEIAKSIFEAMNDVTIGRNLDRMANIFARYSKRNVAAKVVEALVR